MPDQGKQPYRVILWLHPGGFTMGDKEMIRYIDPIHSSPENIKAALDFLDEQL